MYRIGKVKDKHVSVFQTPDLFQLIVGELLKYTVNYGKTLSSGKALSPLSAALGSTNRNIVGRRVMKMETSAVSMCDRADISQGGYCRADQLE